MAKRARDLGFEVTAGYGTGESGKVTIVVTDLVRLLENWAPNDSTEEE